MTLSIPVGGREGPPRRILRHHPLHVVRAPIAAPAPDVVFRPSRTQTVYDQATVVSESPGLTILELNEPRYLYGDYNLRKPGMLEKFLAEGPSNLIAEYNVSQKIIAEGRKAPKQIVWLNTPPSWDETLRRTPEPTVIFRSEGLISKRPA